MILLFFSSEQDFMKQFKKCWVYLGCADRDELKWGFQMTQSLLNYGANDQPGVEVEHQPATKNMLFQNVGLSCNYVLTQWLAVFDEILLMFPQAYEIH